MQQEGEGGKGAGGPCPPRYSIWNQHSRWALPPSVFYLESAQRVGLALLGILFGISTAGGPCSLDPSEGGGGESGRGGPRLAPRSLIHPPSLIHSSTSFLSLTSLPLQPALPPPSRSLTPSRSIPSSLSPPFLSLIPPSLPIPSSPSRINIFSLIISPHQWPCPLINILPILFASRDNLSKGDG